MGGGGGGLKINRQEKRAGAGKKHQLLPTGPGP